VLKVPNYDLITEVNKYITSSKAKCSEDVERFIERLVN
jgi:hypothetical protein